MGITPSNLSPVSMAIHCIYKSQRQRISKNDAKKQALKTTKKKGISWCLLLLGTDSF